MDNISHLSVSNSDFSGNELRYVNDCLNRGWITQGKYVKQLESSFAARHHSTHAIACSSGTAALHLAMLALGINSNHDVIVPALTYVATANAASYCGAQVYFADIRLDDWCMDVLSADEIQSGLVSSAIRIPVDLYDAVCCATPDDVVDASHTPGLPHEGLISAYSFYASKIIACGEGGIVLTNDDNLASLARLYRGQGVERQGGYKHTVIGYNYRMTDISAAIALAQLERLDENLAIRRAIINRYRYNLGNSSITLQGGERASGWIMAILLPDGTDRLDISNRLYAVHGIETRPFFEPLPSLSPYFQRDWRDRYPITSKIASRGLCLPTHTLLTVDDVDYICHSLLEEIRR